MPAVTARPYEGCHRADFAAATPGAPPRPARAPLPVVMATGRGPRGPAARSPCHRPGRAGRTARHDQARPAAPRAGRGGAEWRALFQEQHRRVKCSQVMGWEGRGVTLPLPCAPPRPRPKDTATWHLHIRPAARHPQPTPSYRPPLRCLIPHDTFPFGTAPTPSGDR